jgi:hypothetical protein
LIASVVDAGPLIKAITDAVAANGVLIAEGMKPVNVGSKPYVVAFFDAGTIGDRSLKSRDGFSVYASFQCAGLSPESARFAVTKLRQAVLGLFNTTVGDRRLLMPSHEFGGPMDRDDDADPVLFVQIDEWRFRAS